MTEGNVLFATSEKSFRAIYSLMPNSVNIRILRTYLASTIQSIDIKNEYSFHQLSK